MRADGREPGALREISITPNFLRHPLGSCLIEMGKTRVVCAASMDEGVPPFLRSSGRGWLTAEYSMIPGSTDQRSHRERFKVGGRTKEIERLIGRSLRACVDFSLVGERTILIDCDVIDADGGTRTAAVTGGFVALALALRKIETQLSLPRNPLTVAVAGVSVGLVQGEARLDLDYEDDRLADVDMNVVKTSDDKYVEIQGTAEISPFDRASLDRLLELADSGIRDLLAIQRRVLSA